MASLPVYLYMLKMNSSFTCVKNLDFCEINNKYCCSDCFIVFFLIKKKIHIDII